jgi:hypothetical protein
LTRPTDAHIVRLVRPGCGWKFLCAPALLEILAASPGLRESALCAPRPPDAADPGAGWTLRALLGPPGTVGAAFGAVDSPPDVLWIVRGGQRHPVPTWLGWYDATYDTPFLFGGHGRAEGDLQYHARGSARRRPPTRPRTGSGARRSHPLGAAPS